MPRKGSNTSTASDTKNAQRRIKRELMEYTKSTEDQTIYHIEMVEDDVFDLVGHIYGPPDSPFEGGAFKVEVKVPTTYPFSPPKVKFVTRVWHPNVSSQTGLICLDILKDKWAASLTLRTVMLSLTALLTSPEPDDPQDAVVARQYKDKNELYKQTAAFWTFLFAIEKKDEAAAKKWADFEGKIQKVLDTVHCDRAVALSALSCQNWDIEAALKSLA